MATIPAGLKTCLRAPAGQTKTLLGGKSDFPRSKPPLSPEESQPPVSGRFRHDANGTPCIWYLFTNHLFTTWVQAPEFQLWTWPQVIRISTLDLAPGDKNFNFGPDPRWPDGHPANGGLRCWRWPTAVPASTVTRRPWSAASIRGSWWLTKI